MLAIRGAEFPFTHNLALLLQLCADAGIDVPADLDEADLLTPCAVQIRYGTAMAGHVDREAALLWASEATRWARSLFA